MNKYSQGEWRFMRTYYGCEVWTGDRLAFAYEKHPDAENIANARLMAASKDLLEALQDLLLEAEVNSSPKTIQELVSITKANTAIDKAIGDTQ